MDRDELNAAVVTAHASAAVTAHFTDQARLILVGPEADVYLRPEGTGHPLEQLMRLAFDFSGLTAATHFVVVQPVLFGVFPVDESMDDEAAKTAVQDIHANIDPYDDPRVRPLVVFYGSDIAADTDGIAFVTAIQTVHDDGSFEWDTGPEPPESLLDSNGGAVLAACWAGREHDGGFDHDVRWARANRLALNSPLLSFKVAFMPPSTLAGVQ